MIDEYSQDYLDKNKARYRAALQASPTEDEARDILDIIGYLPIAVHNYSTGESNIRLIGELSNEDIYNLAQETYLLSIERVLREMCKGIVFEEVHRRLRNDRGGDGM